MLKLKELTQMVEEHTNRKIDWELGKNYIARDKETDQLLATYDPKTGYLAMERVGRNLDKDIKEAEAILEDLINDYYLGVATLENIMDQLQHTKQLKVERTRT